MKVSGILILAIGVGIAVLAIRGTWCQMFGFLAPPGGCSGSGSGTGTTGTASDKSGKQSAPPLNPLNPGSMQPSGGNINPQGCGGSAAIHDNAIGWIPGIMQQPAGCTSNPNKSISIFDTGPYPFKVPSKCACCPDGYHLMTLISQNGLLTCAADWWLPTFGH